MRHLSKEGYQPETTKERYHLEIIFDSGKSDKTDHHPGNQQIQKLINEIINDYVTPSSAAEVPSPLERFDHKDALSTSTLQVTPEVPRNPEQG